MHPANVRLRSKDSVVGGLDTGVSNAPTTLETISNLYVMMYGLHVRTNDKCTCNILKDMLMSIQWLGTITKCICMSSCVN